MEPELSIVIPCFNSEETLAETLVSVINQNFENWEAIIVNDGSTDNTEKIALEWVKKDKRFKYFYKENEGLGKTRNFGIRKAKGDYVLPLDSDNLVRKNFAQEALQIFKDQPNCGIVYGNAQLFGAEEGVWKVGKFNKFRMLKHNYIDACAIIRKSLFDELGGYEEDLPYQGHEDWDFWLKVIPTKYEFFYLEEITFDYRVTNSSMIKSFSEDMLRENIRYIKTKHFDLFLESYNELFSENKKLRKKIEKIGFLSKMKGIFKMKRRTKIELMDNRPLVSICIPTHNGEKFLEEALQSVVQQSYKNIELVISDDRSKDKTLSIIEKFKTEADFPILLVHHKPNGIGANWNNSIRHARGEYIKFLFQDDLLYPTCIEELMEVLIEHQDVAIVACKRSVIIEGEFTSKHKSWLHFNSDLQLQLEPNKNGNYLLDRSFFKSKDFLKNPKNKIGEPTMTLIRKSIFNKIGLFDENLVQILDFEFYNRVLKVKKVYIINKKLAAFRIHVDQATSKNRNKTPEDYNKYYKTLYKDYFWFLDKKNQKKLLKKYSWFGKLYTYLKYDF